MQLLGEIDGFDALDNVKIIAATNRIDILDEAIMRPGRLERHIEVGLPSEDDRYEILKIHTKNMKLEKDVDLKIVAKQAKNFSGAELKALTTEAGYIAIKGDNKKISQDCLIQAIEVVKNQDDGYDVLSHSYS